MKTSTIRALQFLLVCLIPASSPAEGLKFNTQDFAPFNYEIGGVVSGPAADIIRRVCEKMDITCTFKLLPWRRAQQEVKSGEANGMFIIGWNEKRAKWVHFTPPIMNTEYGFFVNNDNSLKYKQLSDIEGYTVGVFGPSNTATSLNKIKGEMAKEGQKPIKIDMRPDDEAGFKKLALARLDAVFSNRDVGHALIAKLGLQGEIRYAGASRSLKYYIGFAQDHNDKAVLEKFDATYLELYKRGVIKKILDRYQMELSQIE
jgi:polar amino acid transport system substrate-binding protein